MKTISIPRIVTANTYFWNSASHASTRRANERKNMQAMTDFKNTLLSALPENTVFFEYDYSESCKNVYKHFYIYRMDKTGAKKKTNMTWLINFCAKHNIQLT